jgi:hypothetical protein
MSRSQINPPRSFKRFSASDLATSYSSVATAPLTPFPATLRGKPQLIENPAALSRVVATLTRHVRHKPFVCHSYKKHPGSHLSSQRSFRSCFPRLNFLPTRHSPLATKSFNICTSTKRACNSRRIRTSKTQDLKPFRMNTYKKTPGGRAHPSSRFGPAAYSLLPIHYSRKARQLFTVARKAAPSRSGCRVCKT